MNGKSRLVNFILVAMLAVGTCLLLYPTVSDWWNSTRQSQAITDYMEAASALSDSRRESMLQEARRYNEELPEHASSGCLDDEALERYPSVLDVSGTGIMGYVKIPTLGISLPVYHGTDESVLQVAVGHLEWTSLPVGGEGTHCAISGHRGLPSASLFSDIDRLAEGEAFELHVLDEVYAYEVDQILIVEPYEIEALKIVPGEDLCTLVTCTPYGINTHRLLVRGHRVDAPAITIVESDASQIGALTVAGFLAVPLLVLAVILLLAGDALRRRKRAAAKAAMAAVAAAKAPTSASDDAATR